MAHRQFIDSRGQKWDVWDVQPTKVERRRDSRDLPYAEERRQRDEFRVRLGSNFGDGWLCFECPCEKRRVAPVPAEWEMVDPTQLELLCAQGTVVKNRSHSAPE